MVQIKKAYKNQAQKLDRFARYPVFNKEMVTALAITLTYQ